jgi:antitoxin HicB
MNTNYPINLYMEVNGDESYWIAEYPDLPGCIGVGNTQKEAVDEAEIFKEMWLETAKEIGKLIPPPRDIYSRNFSGKFNTRVPKELHRNLAIEAELQGVSMNSLCEIYLERGIAQDRYQQNSVPAAYSAGTITVKEPEETRIASSSWLEYRSDLYKKVAK